MFRRCLCILVMLAFAAGQMAAFPHAHAQGTQPADHDARPHMHIAWFGHDHHCRDGEHCHHRDADDRYSHSLPPATENEQDGHDSDAVYLPSNVGVSLPVKIVAVPDGFQDVAMVSVTVSPVPAAISESSAMADFPDKCSRGCPLYLALRALRI